MSVLIHASRHSPYGRVDRLANSHTGEVAIPAPGN